ncbi:MAG: hypothetical protein V1816_23555 [Pseudomonadota bacterium]
MRTGNRPTGSDDYSNPWSKLEIDPPTPKVTHASMVHDHQVQHLVEDYNFQLNNFSRSQDVKSQQFDSVSQSSSLFTETVYNSQDFFPIQQIIVDTLVMDRGQYFDNVVGSFTTSEQQIPTLGVAHPKVEEYPMSIQMIQSKGLSEEGEPVIERTDFQTVSREGKTEYQRKDLTFSPEPILKEVFSQTTNQEYKDYHEEKTIETAPGITQFSVSTEKRIQQADHPPDLIAPNQKTKKITEESKYGRDMDALAETELAATPIEYRDGFARGWDVEMTDEEKMIAYREQVSPPLAVNEIYTTHSELKGLTIDKLVVDWSR